MLRGARINQSANQFLDRLPAYVYVRPMLNSSSSPLTAGVALARYTAGFDGSPYGDVFGAWLKAPCALDVYDESALDEAASIARMHATTPIWLPIIQTLDAFRADCELTILARMEA